MEFVHDGLFIGHGAEGCKKPGCKRPRWMNRAQCRPCLLRAARYKRERRLAPGFCSTCYKVRAPLGRKTCRRCAERSRQYQRTLRDAYRQSIRTMFD